MIFSTSTKVGEITKAEMKFFYGEAIAIKNKNISLASKDKEYRRKPRGKGTKREE